jgi:hypothetical protein
MALTYTDILNKAKSQASTLTTNQLTQIMQDYNQGYQTFLSKLNRYWVRKQQFANLVSGQQIYQLPIDVNKTLEVTVQVTSSYIPPLVKITSERDWRRITSYPMQSSWPTYYFIIGAREIALWPIPAASVTLGLRVVYQPRAYSLSIADLTSTSSSLATVTNASTTVTLASSVLTTSQAGLYFQATGILDDTFYPIVSSTSSTLTLESPYVASTAASQAWRIGQLPQLPPEFHDAPLHYAMWLFFSANNNTTRATAEKLMFDDLTAQALSLYSSSSEASIITDEAEAGLNIWLVPPPAA